MEFYRTVIALPMEVGREVHQLVETLKESLAAERISWVDPQRYHLTLRFLGDTPLEQVRIIGKKIREEVNSEPFHIKLSSVGSFGPRKRPRVVWIGIESAEQIHHLYKQTEKLLQSCGFPPEKNGFKPHLTLGRVRGLKDLNNYHRIIESLDSQPLGVVKVGRIVYYRSVLGAGGPVYSPLYQVKFGK
jgi:2'-5' RNA ligase